MTDWGTFQQQIKTCGARTEGEVTGRLGADGSVFITSPDRGLFGNILGFGKSFGSRTYKVTQREFTQLEQEEPEFMEKLKSCDLSTSFSRKRVIRKGGEVAGKLGAGLGMVAIILIGLFALKK